MAELKPCPLCGQKPMLDRHEIYCDNCHLIINFSDFVYSGEADDWEEAKEMAVKTWNTRTPQKLNHNSLCETETYKVGE